MTDKFFKTRVPETLYATLLAEAGAAGKRLNTHVRELQQQHAQAVSTTEALARIEASISATQAAPQPGALDHDTQRQLTGGIGSFDLSGGVVPYELWQRAGDGAAVMAATGIPITGQLKSLSDDWTLRTCRLVQQCKAMLTRPVSAMPT